MDTSADENYSRFESSGEEHEQDEFTEAQMEEIQFPEPLAGVGMHVEPEPHRCKAPFYSFTSGSHHLMVRSILDGKYATASEISEADPTFLHALGRDKSRKIAGVEGRWKVFQDRLQAEIDDHGYEQLYFKTTPGKFIAHTGQWAQILQTYHVDAQNRHYGVSGTIDRCRQLWITDTRRHGIPELYVQAYISQCIVCNPSLDSIPSSHPLEGKRIRPSKFNYPVRLEVPVKLLPKKLEALAIEHRVVLRVLHSKRIAPCPFLSEVISYICHRGQFKRVREKREGPITEKRRCRPSFRCGCNFRIKTLTPIYNYNSKTATYDYLTEGTAIVLLNPVHSGHEPGTEEDLLHLPVHPSALQECEADRGDIKDVQAISRASLRRAPALKAQASELDQATFRFYLTKRETQRLPYNRKLKEKLAKDSAKALQLKYGELQTVDETLSNQLEPNREKWDDIAPAEETQEPWVQYMPARRLGFQKVLARLADATHASLVTDQQMLGTTEGDASVYYSKQRPPTRKLSARRNPASQMRWLKEVEYHERHGRDTSRLDIVSNGISQFHKLQLTEEMDTDVAHEEQALEEARLAMSHELHELEKELGSLMQRAGELSVDQLNTATVDLKACRQKLMCLGGMENTAILGTADSNPSNKPVRVHYISTQSGQDSDSLRLGEDTILESEFGGYATSAVQMHKTQIGLRLKKSTGMKRKRMSLPPTINKLPCAESGIQVLCKLLSYGWSNGFKVKCCPLKLRVCPNKSSLI